MIKWEMKRKDLTPEEVLTMSALIARYKFVLCVAERNGVYMLHYHYRYLDPEYEAPRVKLFKSKRIKDGVYYNTSI